MLPTRESVRNIGSLTDCLQESPRSCWVGVMAQYLNDHCGQRLQPVTEMYLYSAFPGVQ